MPASYQVLGVCHACMLAKGCQEHKGFTPTQGADADAAGVRALAAYKDFLILWKDTHPTSPSTSTRKPSTPSYIEDAQAAMAGGFVRRFTCASTRLVPCLANRLMVIRMPLFELCGVVSRWIFQATA